MNSQEVANLKPGDRVYRWVWTGMTGGGEFDQADIQELVVVRVNRRTVTADTQHHGRMRIPYEQIEGRADWD